jgi:hypothetical protein
MGVGAFCLTERFARTVFEHPSFMRLPSNQLRMISVTKGRTPNFIKPIEFNIIIFL